MTSIPSTERNEENESNLKWFVEFADEDDLLGAKEARVEADQEVVMIESKFLVFNLGPLPICFFPHQKNMIYNHEMIANKLPPKN